MKEYGGIVRAVTAWLNEREIPARGGWSEEERIAEDRPIVMVSVKSYAAAHGGFENYLGERYDTDTAAWEEVYGKRVELELGLDLYAEETCGQEWFQETAQELIRVLTLETPAGLRVDEIRCGEIRWDEKLRCLKQEITARCTAWLVAVRREGTEFLDFELRGGWKL